MKERLRIGAVIYDPRVKLIWDIIKEFFDSSGYPVGCAATPTAARFST